MFLSRNIKSIIGGTIIIALLVFTFVVIEYYESRKELLSSLTNEAVNLSDALTLSFENALVSNDEIESQIVNKLDAVGALMAHLQFNKKSAQQEISKFLKDFEIDHFSILDKTGQVTLTSNSSDYSKRLPEDFLLELNPIFLNETSLIELGINQNPINDEQMYMIARPGAQIGTAVLVGLNAEKVLRFRKKVGIGNQIQEIADNPDIIYLILQDEDGILSASKGVNEVASIDSDEFLKNAIKTNETKTRIIDFKGSKVFEAVKVFQSSDGSKILNRVALSLENVMAIQQRSMRRVILIGIGIFTLFSVLYALMLTRRGFQSLKKDHNIIKSYTDLVLENMIDGVVAVDRNNQILYFNQSASKILGIQTEVTIQKNYSHVFKDDILLLNKSRLKKISYSDIEIDYIDPQNIRKIIEINTSFIFDDENNVDLAIAIIKDLTEKKNLQIQLERRDKLFAMGELAAGVAHEIRNPLNSINVIAQRIQKEFEPISDKDEYMKLISIVRSEVNRVNNIIKQFLEYARPAKLHKELFNINTLIEDSILIIESEARQQNIIINREFEKSLDIPIDVEKFKQVLINLLRNSIESIDNGGHITVSTHRTANSLRIMIADTGAGIPNDILSKIFNLYFTTKATGNGLGLSIVHQIISEHNGQISIESNVNQGTNVLINLPI
jgi:two-component system sensor histidine kinase HydH